MNALDNLIPHYQEILEMMPDEFDSHQFILKLAHKHQVDYVEALYMCRDVKDGAPFRELHGQISKSLHDYATHNGEISSPDIFGTKNDNALWLKSIKANDMV